MIKKVIVFIMVVILLTSCTQTKKSNEDNSVFNKETKDNVEDTKSDTYTPTIETTGSSNTPDVTITETGENPDDENVLPEYLTGEIITDGTYRYFESVGFGLIDFVPDKESKKIIDKLSEYEREMYFLKYTELSIVDQLPKRLGIYKVRVKVTSLAPFEGPSTCIQVTNIQPTNEIGTILYEGKKYETNNLDESVRAKDKVCGLIVKRVVREDYGGVIIDFAGDILSEGYYSLYNGMYGDKVGSLIVDDSYYSNFPIYLGEQKDISVYFYDEGQNYKTLEETSGFGRGKFKTNGYTIVYNIGMGMSAGESITKIISLDSGYFNLFTFDSLHDFAVLGAEDDYAIVKEYVYKEPYNIEELRYYYINRNNKEKILLFTTPDAHWNYIERISELEFILECPEEYSAGELITGSKNVKFTITDEGVITEILGD